jgi:hypothetical protein
MSLIIKKYRHAHAGETAAAAAATLHMTDAQYYLIVKIEKM